MTRVLTRTALAFFFQRESQSSDNMFFEELKRTEPRVVCVCGWAAVLCCFPRNSSTRFDGKYVVTALANHQVNDAKAQECVGSASSLCFVCVSVCGCFWGGGEVYFGWCCLRGIYTRNSNRADWSWCYGILYVHEIMKNFDA